MATTVRKLIEALQKLPDQDAPIVVRDEADTLIYLSTDNIVPDYEEEGAIAIRC